MAIVAKKLDPQEAAAAADYYQQELEAAEPQGGDVAREEVTYSARRQMAGV